MQEPTHPAQTLALQHMLSLTRSASVICEEAGSWQQDVLRRSAALQREAAGELVRAVNPAEMLNVQAAYALAGWQQMVECSRELGDRIRTRVRLG